MATKNEMELEILKVFDDNSKAFGEIGVTRLVFTGYLVRFQKYNDLRKVNRFLQKLIPPLLAVSRVLLYFTADAWIMHKQHNKGQKQVMLLRDATRDLKTVWVKRPKAPRKGSE